MIFEYAIIIFLIIIIILTLRSINYINNTSNYTNIYKNIPFERISLASVLTTLKTGDLLYYRNAISSFMMDRLIPTDVYKHVSMIVRIDNDLFSTESSLGEFYSKQDSTEEPLVMFSGVNVLPLINRLKYYSGLVFLHRLNKPLSLENEQKLVTYINNSIGTPYPTMLSLYMNFTFNVKISKDLYCYEYVYSLLEYIDLIPTKKKNARDISEYIAKLCNFELNYGYRYEPGRLIVFDLDGVE